MPVETSERELIVFLDCGDTLIDQGTEVFDEEGVVIRGELIPGADTMVKTLVQRGYRLALVADGRAQSFKNLLQQHDLYDLFEALIYSETIKAEKPSPRMFKAAVGAMDLGPEDYGRIVMVGNNLSRDVRGAKQLGIASVFIDWSPRYPKTPADEAEVPDYIIHEPMGLLDIIDQIESKLPGQKVS
ncbi:MULTISPECIES: HAD family hydrolase [Paenibacillus]|uniref:Hydrolase n=1 Tax=Paenibacillus campinasensis TaxID=66347 RepID=A0A268EPK6_9BACL|nr:MULTISPECIES: HAD family hydrolase [Paenibacillus]MUG67457.1 HAD-IA family hydrolase [Paenibacillus campinasensis]PAD75057.1 hydrolase [Paenibacillus campinasensis]PAK50558.1 hydrolase [Paenibacillus sp. 7541]